MNIKELTKAINVENAAIKKHERRIVGLYKEYLNSLPFREGDFVNFGEDWCEAGWIEGMTIININASPSIKVNYRPRSVMNNRKASMAANHYILPQKVDEVKVIDPSAFFRRGVKFSLLPMTCANCKHRRALNVYRCWCMYYSAYTTVDGVPCGEFKEKNQIS